MSAPGVLARPSTDPCSLAPQKSGTPLISDGDEPEKPEPQPPVPFILLILVVSAAVFAVLPLFGACSVQVHRGLLFSGAVLVLPFVVLQAAWLCGGRSWILERFFEGEYSEGATSRQLPCLWYPEKVQILQYTTGEIAGRTIETYVPSWETTAIQVYQGAEWGGNRDGGNVAKEPASRELEYERSVRLHGLKNAPELNGLHGTCLSFENGRWRVQLQNGDVKDVKPENLRLINTYSVNIPSSFGSDVKVTLNADGQLQGSRLPFEAVFDGSTLVALSGTREGQAWRKAGYWRLDLVKKLLMAMAVVGLESMFVAAALPPGVVSMESARLPLKAVFLLDGSGSVIPTQWIAELQANKQFVSDFTKVYGSVEGRLNFGFVQFSTTANVELPMTTSLDKVMGTLGSMQQRGGDTNFAEALSACQKLLDGDKEVGDNSFDLCVLITDGEDRSWQTDSNLKHMVKPETAVFGIFVGNDPLGQTKLHNIVGCGRAAKHDEECDFFASAADFDALLERTHEIAQDVTRSSDLALCAERSAIIELPFLVVLILPYVLWYLSCFTVTMVQRHAKSNHYKPLDPLPMLGDRA